ncbi:MAG TPA: S8 family serine peptidase, partial [Armatimonadota bacterium]|nr:S8 family serine peptidase [Armatimonadota bacterium]
MNSNPTASSLSAAAFVLLLGGAVGAAPAQAGGIAPDLQQQIRNLQPQAAARAAKGPKVPVIVQFKTPGVNSRTLARALGGQVLRTQSLINGAALLLPLQSVGALSRRPEVAWVSPDRKLNAQRDYDTESIGARDVWSTYDFKGKGIRVAVLDTGVVNGTAEWVPEDANGNAAKRSRVVAFKDLVNGRNSPYDDNGHGTHVAGIVMGSGIKSAHQYRGVAPKADLVAVKVLGQDGSGSVSTVINGIEWCIQNQSRLALRVLNLSLGHQPGESVATDPLCLAVRRAVRAGLVVVVAAGNQGKDSTGRIT